MIFSTPSIEEAAIFLKYASTSLSEEFKPKPSVSLVSSKVTTRDLLISLFFAMKIEMKSPPVDPYCLKAASYGFLKRMSLSLRAKLLTKSGVEISSVTDIPPTRSSPKANDLFFVSPKVEPSTGYTETSDLSFKIWLINAAFANSSASG